MEKYKDVTKIAQVMDDFQKVVKRKSKLNELEVEINGNCLLFTITEVQEIMKTGCNKSPRIRWYSKLDTNTGSATNNWLIRYKP